MNNSLHAAFRASLLLALSALSFDAAAQTKPGSEQPGAGNFAARAGWAYGLGLELEWRPGHWGAGVSGGYVPGYGVGGYLGLQLGLESLDRSGFVGEAGVFRGVENPLRDADTGYGPYLMAGYNLVHAGWLSARLVAGGGVPIGDSDHPFSVEPLAKLTLGVVF